MARCRPEVSRRCVWALASVGRKRVALALSAALGLTLACTLACTREQPPERAHDPAVPAAPAMAGPRASVTLDAEDGQWTMPAKSYNAARYSQLGQITAANVATMRPAW